MNGLTLRALKGSALSSAEHDDGLATVRLIQASHGMVAGSLVYPSSETAWAKAIATAAATVATGCVVDISGDSAYIALARHAITLPAHGLGAAGTIAYLSQSIAGGAGAKPVNGIQQPVFQVINANLVIWTGNPVLWQEI